MTQSLYFQNILNLKQAEIQVFCSYCGEPTIGQKGRDCVWTCRNCRKKRRAYLQRERRDRKRQETVLKADGFDITGRVSRYQTLHLNEAVIRTNNELPVEGELRFDTDKIQCHICGQWYYFLASHVIQTHHISVDDYRDIYSLNRRQPLIVPQLSALLSKLCRDREFWKLGSAPFYKHLARLYMDPHFLRRRQTRFNLSDALTGITPKLTEKRKQSQKRNIMKSFLERPCDLCSKVTLAHKSAAHAYCRECRPLHMEQYQKAYREAHRLEMREYMKAYDAKRRKRPRAINRRG